MGRSSLKLRRCCHVWLNRLNNLPWRWNRARLTLCRLSQLEVHHDPSFRSRKNPLWRLPKRGSAFRSDDSWSRRICRTFLWFGMLREVEAGKYWSEKAGRISIGESERSCIDAASFVFNRLKIIFFARFPWPSCALIRVRLTSFWYWRDRTFACGVLRVVRECCHYFLHVM